MKKRAVLAILGLAVAVAASTTAHATPSQTATYVTGGTVAAASGSAGSQNTVSAAGIGRGGYTFAVSTKPLTMRITDEVMGASNVGYTACQTISNDDVNLPCGQAGTVTQVGCTSGTVTLNAGFVSGKALTVFVHAFNLDCDGFGTTGRITITYS